MPALRELPLELSPVGVPVSLRPFFQDYDFDSVRPDVDAFTIIERTLAWGNRLELGWLFEHYPFNQIATFVREAGWQRLPSHRFYFWLNVLHLVEYQHSDYPRQWPH